MVCVTTSVANWCGSNQTDRKEKSVGDIMILLEEALRRFKLIGRSIGSLASNKACPVSALSWIANVEWSDHPSCAHPLICDIVINAADDVYTTQADREALVRAGVTGLIDTAGVPTEVVLAAISGARLLHVLAGEAHTTEEMRLMVPPVTQALCMLEGITAWKKGARGYTGPLFLAGLRLGVSTRVDLHGCNLRDADFRGAKFVYATFRGADLRGANTSRADFTGTNFAEADLRDTDFTLADLYGANFSCADLRGANFAHADLFAANFCGANVDGADFTGADLRSVQWTYPVVPPGWRLVHGLLKQAS
jgi:hypothetical protein